MSFIFPVLNLHHLGDGLPWRLCAIGSSDDHKSLVDWTIRAPFGAQTGSSSWGHVEVTRVKHPGNDLISCGFVFCRDGYNIWRFITEKISYRFGYVMNFIWLGVWKWSRNSPSLCLKMDFSLGIVMITRQGRTRIMGKGGKGKGKITKAGFRRETSELLMLLLVCIYT